MVTADVIARALNGRKAGGQWICQCPAHEDRRPSLAVQALVRGGLTARQLRRITETYLTLGDLIIDPPRFGERHGRRNDDERIRSPTLVP